MPSLLYRHGLLTEGEDFAELIMLLPCREVGRLQLQKPELLPTAKIYYVSQF